MFGYNKITFPAVLCSYFSNRLFLDKYTARG